jgi:hypothetical protein
MIDKWFWCLPALLFGCASAAITPRQNFDGMLRSFVGIDLRKVEGVSTSLGYRGLLLQSRILPNGNKENFYRLPYQTGEPPQQCTYILEINPETQKVVSVKIASGENACIIPL